MAKKEFKQLFCSDVGMACGFQVRTETEAEVIEHLKMHAARVHGLNEIPPDLEKKIKTNIKSVPLDV
jgi:predicted small metal-binding protein